MTRFEYVPDAVRRTFAYAAGVAVAQIADDTEIVGLGLDSVGATALGVVLDAELEMEMTQEDLLRIIGARTVGDAIQVAIGLARVADT